MTGNSIVTRSAAFANLLRILVPARDSPPKHPDLHTLWLQAGALPASMPPDHPRSCATWNCSGESSFPPASIIPERLSGGPVFADRN